jgi:anti-sigma regulatory factor (Ser/Thr protein kinase)
MFMDTPASAPRAAPARPGTTEESHRVTESPAGLRAARDFVRDVMLRWGVETRAANAALDVAHELVTNAVRHGHGPVTLVLALDDGAVVVTVADASPEPARRLPYRSGISERGLGLRLVSQLSREWGQRPAATGKSVWAAVPLRPPRPR